MTYDSNTAACLLFGGMDNNFSYNGETWGWYGDAWYHLAPAHSPSPRIGHAMAFDSGRSVTVLYGGSLQQGGNETWEWNGFDWTQRATSGPPSLTDHVMAYDSARRVTVLFGGNGLDNTGGFPRGDTWEWNGVNWSRRAVTGPPPRMSSAMVYDASRGVTVLFGGRDYTIANGYDARTWEWDGANWTVRAATGPSPRDGHAMAYDSARGVAVLYGGSYCDSNCYTYSDTWEWNGSTWTQRAGSGPPIRWGHAMAFDAERRRTMLFGGTYNSGRNDTWSLSSAPAGTLPFTLSYCSTPAPGGGYDYRFTLVADNHDGTWRRGYGLGWIVFGDGPQASPLPSFTPDYSNFPLGPWTGMGTTVGSHNGPSLSPNVTPSPNYFPIYWTPPSVGAQLTWRIRSASYVAPGQMLWSALLAEHGPRPDFVVATAACGPLCASADFNHDGDVGTDQDIEAFFACLAGRCCATCSSADFNGDGDVGTDQDIEAFFRVLAGGSC